MSKEHAKSIQGLQTSLPPSEALRQQTPMFKATQVEVKLNAKAPPAVPPLGRLKQEDQAVQGHPGLHKVLSQEN